MKKTTGKIKSVSQKEKSYGITLEEAPKVWYNGFGQSKVNKGDVVEIDWEYNDQYKSNSIKEIKVVQTTEKDVNYEEQNSRKRRIIDCLLEVYKKGSKELEKEATELYLLSEEIYNKIYEPETASTYGAEVIKI